MVNWYRSLILCLLFVFGLLAILVFSVFFYLGCLVDVYMVELDAHELHGCLSLIEYLVVNESSVLVLVCCLGDVLVGEHGVIAVVDGLNGLIFRWFDVVVADFLSVVADGLVHELCTLTVGVS